MSSNDDKDINYSELFSQLITRDNKLNDSILTFLYYMFPRDLFIRALSLLESNDMMIYILNEKAEETRMPAVASRSDTFVDKLKVDSIGDTTVSIETSTDPKATSNHNTESRPPTGNEVLGKSETTILTTFLRRIFENDDYQLMYRFLVKSSNNDKEPPIYVDLNNWSCSCKEYCEQFYNTIHADPERSVSELITTEIDDVDKFKDDRMGQLDAHSFSKQRYFKHDKVMCPHLLAYSILLRSSFDVLKYFVFIKSNVLIIRVNSIDEWLRLHINIVV